MGSATVDTDGAAAGHKKRAQAQGLMRAQIAAFLRGCDNPGVLIYGPYPPCKGRSRWRLQVVDAATGHKKSVTAPSLPAALELKTVLQREVQRHVPVTLHQVLEPYLAHKATLTGKRWLHLLGLRLRMFLPDVPVGQLSPERAERLYEAETRRVARFGVVKAATHQAVLRNTKAFFRWLIKKNLATRNPFERVEPIGKPNAGKDQPRETDARTLDQLLQREAAGGDEGALALLLQIYLGLRSSEVLSLRVEAVERGGEKITVVRGKTKNAKRALELYPVVAALLWKHCHGRPGDERVFAANRTEQPNPDWMRKRLHRFCKLAGLRPYCPHALRGLHSTLALASGATTHHVAASLGHASFSTTARHYADASTLDNARNRRLASVLSQDGDGLARAVQALSEEERGRLLVLLRGKRG